MRCTHDKGDVMGTTRGMWWARQGGCDGHDMGDVVTTLAM